MVGIRFQVLGFGKNHRTDLHRARGLTLQPSRHVALAQRLFTGVLLMSLPWTTQAQRQNAPSFNELPAAEYQQRRIDFDIAPYKEDLQRVQDYLQELTTLESRFTQTTAQTSGINMGKVYISKPGKARWEYKIPTPRLVIVKDDELVYYDVELNEVTYTDTPPPLKLFLSDAFDLFDPSIRILDVKRSGQTLTIALTESDNIQDDRLSYEALILTFGLHPVQLDRIQTVDGNNNAVTLELLRPKFGEELDDELFIFKDPRPIKERRNIP